MRRRRGSLGSFCKGALFGGLALGSVALLFAPKEGKKTRKALKKSLDDACHLFDNMHKSTKKTARKIKKRTSRET